MHLMYIITAIGTTINVAGRAFLHQILLLLIYNLDILVVLLSPVRTAPLNYSHAIRIVFVRVVIITTTIWCNIDDLLLLQTKLSLGAGIKRALDFLFGSERISGAKFSVRVVADGGKVGLNGGLRLAQVRLLRVVNRCGCCGIGSLNCYHFEFLTL